MNTEQKDMVYRIYGKLAAGWLELGHVITTLEKEGADVEALKKAKAKIHEGVGAVLFSLEVTEEEEED